MTLQSIKLMWPNPALELYAYEREPESPKAYSYLELHQPECRQDQLNGRINLTLNSGQQSLDKNSATVISYLKKHDGYAPLHDKSDPKDISAALGISKAAFKKAIGSLYKQRIILIEDGGIRMVTNDE